MPPIVSTVYRPTHCKVCGRPLQDRAGSRGRPALYCPPLPDEDVSLCARLDKRMSEIQSIAERLVERLGDAESEDARRSLMALRSYVWRELNIATNQRKLVNTGAAPYTKRRDGWRRNAGRNASSIKAPVEPGDLQPASRLAVRSA